MDILLGLLSYIFSQNNYVLFSGKYKLINEESMKTRLLKFIIATTFLASATANAEWSIIGLGTMGGISSLATGINDSGQVVGSYYNSDFELYAFSTGPNGTSIFELGTLGGAHSVAEDINESGQVAGASYLPNSTTLRAFLTDSNGKGMTGLGEGPLSYAMDLNNSGMVVGFATFGSDQFNHSFITGPNGSGINDMGTLGGNSSGALGVNESGQVVGASETHFSSQSSGVYHAFISGPNGTGMTDLGTLSTSRFARSIASDINESGQVVGVSDIIPNSINHAFITGPNGIGMTDLGTLGGIGNSSANAINDYGQVVGVSQPYSTLNHGFIYSDGVMVDLSLLEQIVSAGWTRISPLAMNNSGQIVGEGVLNGVTQGFIISGAEDRNFYLNYIPPNYDITITPPPIPEPSTYLMLLAGLGLVGWRIQKIHIKGKECAGDTRCNNPVI